MAFEFETDRDLMRDICWVHAMAMDGESEVRTAGRARTMGWPWMEEGRMRIGKICDREKQWEGQWRGKQWRAENLIVLAQAKVGRRGDIQISFEIQEKRDYIGITTSYSYRLQRQWVDR
jgi:hypothetical protein